jgi:hypothetical protein
VPLPRGTSEAADHARPRTTARRRYPSGGARRACRSPAPRARSTPPSARGWHAGSHLAMHARARLALCILSARPICTMHDNRAPASFVCHSPLACLAFVPVHALLSPDRHNSGFTYDTTRMLRNADLSVCLPVYSVAVCSPLFPGVSAVRG